MNGNYALFYHDFLTEPLSYAMLFLTGQTTDQWKEEEDGLVCTTTPT
jgi:hypothetical protein